MTENGYRSGADSSCIIAYEDPDVWGEDADSMTASDETYFATGQGVESSIARSNNKVRNVGVGQRNAQSTSALQYSGTLTINGSVSNWYWLLGVLGTNTDGGSGPSSWTHTYTESNTLPTFTARRHFDFSTAQYEQIQGCVTDQCTITAAVNETTKFSLECPFRYSTIETGAFANATDTQSVYTFAGGVIQAPSGTTIAAIQNFELTIVNNAEMVYGVGSRFAQGFAPKNREYNFTFTAAIKNFALLSQIYNGTTGTAPGTGDGAIASMVLTFTNADGHTAVMTFGETHFNEDTLPTSVTEVIKEDITGWCNSLTSIVYTNATETAPAEADNV